MNVPTTVVAIALDFIYKLNGGVNNTLVSTYLYNIDLDTKVTHF